ncbi:MAG: murein biosynthesis integral membrane protein MurJ [Spirochaetales bacterium]|nr:murein biosynthesis integral membrane protein MurJ [Spirochaetales bacterium]
MLLCTLATRLFGLVRNAIINAIFGGAGHADVWHLVFMIPNNLRKLFAEGALSSAFIPVLSSSIIKDPDGESSRKISRNILTFQLIILVPVVLLGLVFARPVINVLALFSDPEKVNLSINLFRFIFPYILFVSISAALMGVLNAKNVFVPPALSPLLFSITVISSIFIFNKDLGIFAMAPGIICGGIAQVLFQLPWFFKKGYDLKLDFSFRNEYFKQILTLWLPILAASSIFTINQQIAMVFASSLENGSTSAIGNALVFFQLPFGMITASITTVLFPRMSRQAAVEDKSGLLSSFTYGINFVLIFLVPATLGYIFLGKQIIALIFERGNFSPLHTEMTYKVLTGYSYGLFGLGAFTFCQRFFYSLKNFTIPLFISTAIVILDVLLSLWLKETPLRVMGLAVANSAAFSLGLVVMFFFVYRKLGSANLGVILGNMLKVGISMLLMTGGLLSYLYFTKSMWTTGSSLINGILILIAVFIALGITCCMYYITGIKLFKDLIRERLFKLWKK